MLSLKSQIDWCTRAQQASIAAVVLVGGLFYVAAYRPHNGRLRELTAKIAQTQRDLEVSQMQVLHLPEVAAKVNDLQGMLRDFKTLPTNPQLGEFTNRMADLQREDNLRELSQNCVGLPKADDQFYELPISYKFEGDFRDVFAFLCQVEEMPRLTRVQSIKIEHLDSSGTVQVDLLMNLYYSSLEG